LILWKTTSPGVGILNNPFAQTVTIKNSEVMASGNTPIKTATHTIDLPPALTAINVSLLNDTGTAGDRITNTPDLKITVGDSNAIAELLVSLDGTKWQNMKSSLLNNVVTIDRAKLETIYGKALTDGDYTLQIRSKDLAGKITNNSFGFGIDTLAPTLEVTGLMDGIRWRSGDRISGSVNDSHLKEVTYRIQGGNSSGNAIVLTSRNGNLDRDLSPDLNALADGAYSMTVSAIDVMGLKTEQSYQFLKQTPQTVIDTDVAFSVTNGSGGGSGGTGSGGTGSGGTGGSSGGTGGTGTGGGIGGGSGSGTGSGGGTGGGSGPGSPQFGGNPIGDYWGPLSPMYGLDLESTAPEKSLNYLERLAFALKTAQQSSKLDLNARAALVNRSLFFMEIGKQVEERSLYRQMSIGSGDQLAYLALSDFYYDFAPTMDRSRVVSESNAFISELIMFNLRYNYDQMSGKWMSTSSIREEALKTGIIYTLNRVFGSQVSDWDYKIEASIEMLAHRYSVLNPNPNTLSNESPNWLDALWRAQFITTDRTEVQRLLELSVNALKTLVGDRLLGATSSTTEQTVERSLNFVSRLLEASSEVRPWDDDIKSARFLQELVEFGFEVAKVKPTIVGPNPLEPVASEWIDTLWRWNGDEKLRSASEGLAMLAGGFDSIDLSVKGLEFAEKLLKTINSVEDPTLRAEILNADVLSELINLGSMSQDLDYQLNLVNWNNTNQLKDFLVDIWAYANSQTIEPQEPLKDIISLSGFIRLDYKLANNGPILFASNNLKELLIGGLESVASKFVLKISQRALRWLAGKGDDISAHIIKGHIARVITKTTFSSGSSVKKLAIRTLENPSRVISEGSQTVFEKDFGRSIGRNGESIVRLIVNNQTGKIVSFYPTMYFKSLTATSVGIILFKADEANASIMQLRRSHEKASEPGWLERIIDFLNPIDSGSTASDDIYLKEINIVNAKIQDAVREIETNRGFRLTEQEQEEVRETLLLHIDY
jgi:Bacterial Ig-like domain